VKVQWNRD